MRCAQCLKEHPSNQFITQLGSTICIHCVRKNRNTLYWIIGVGLFVFFLGLLMMFLA